ncbi:MAG: diguanylate cyclase [Desulfomonilaceae bacterium]|nr:diguanylate cyclase [Desulfomonilaceae bacterium]
MLSVLPPEQSKAQARVLVVDDDPMVREVVVLAIEAMGYEVDACGNGVEALEKNEKRHFDLIVTDMRLPGLDGLSLIEKLRGGPADTDVIVMTGYGSIENAVQCMKAGALEYLIKPFTPDQIQVAVRKSLEHRELIRRAKEREFYRELSYLDALTGVHNRRYLDEALKTNILHAQLHGTSFVLLMVDIDDFKIYNDLNGHVMGDEALAQVGRLLKSVCRGYDVVTRYGGEEFAIIFPHVNKSNALELAYRILKEIRKTQFSGAHAQPTGSLTVSIGVAAYPEHAATAAELVHCADAALYAAKKAGKNTIEVYGSRPTGDHNRTTKQA